jgi:hypothetical protein
MDNIHETMIDGIRVTTELEAEDTLAVLLKRVQLEGLAPRGSLRPVLEKQARSIVEKVTYLDGELSLIEVDGVSNAVQIRSKKPSRTPDAEVRFVEIMLRNGNFISVESRGGALHVSRENYTRLIKDLAGLL